MTTHGQVRRCRCGTRLARDNRGTLCHACTKAARHHLAEPPRVPPGFWRTAEMRDALATCDMGAVMRAFRTHPFHGRPIPQQTAAAWVGITQTRLSRIENGERIANLNSSHVGRMSWASPRTYCGSGRRVRPWRTADLAPSSTRSLGTVMRRGRTWSWLRIGVP